MIKWIGQHIVDLIARFRSDVYLENIDSGTIASGSNLGLDSNNKIVKANEVSVSDADTTTKGIVELATTAETTTGTDATRAVTPDGLQDGFYGSTNIRTLGDITTGNWRGNAIDLTTYVSGVLAVANGGTGASSLTSNSILTGNGTSAVQAESTLSYDSEILDIGADDNGAATIRRLRHTDDEGGDFYIRGGDATGTNKAGGDLQLFGGRATGNAAGGAVIIQAGETNASSGTTLRGVNVIASFRSDGDTLLQGNLIFEGSVPDAHETTFSITNPTADRTITVPDADVDLTKVRAASDTLDGVVELATTAEATTGTDTSRAVTAAGVAAVHATSQTGKHKQIFVQNFVDDLGTDKHFMPFKTNVETTQQYQEESCLIAPFDGRVVSVTIGYAQTQNNPTDITVGVETINSGVSYAGTWTVDETQTETLTGNHHVLHFVFDDAKHFDSTNKIAISIQQAADVQNAERFFWVSTIIEWDYSTALANDEYGSTP
tara:strand:+ start:208 stop:1680 length:1473 start_codon:yes stop_codon:yes gene_type:complete